MSQFFKSLVQSYVYLLCLDPARNGSEGQSLRVLSKSQSKNLRHDSRLVSEVVYKLRRSNMVVFGF